MPNRLPLLDRLKMIGQPYHGLWQGGSITLPNGAPKAVAPTPANGGVVLIRVPGQPAVTRTPAEQAADTAAGLEWRNYALISGGYYGGIGPLYTNGTYAYILFVDNANVRWMMRLFTSQDMVNTMTVALRRFGHMDGTTQGWSADITVSIPADFVTAVNATIVPLMTIAQNTTGSEFVVGGVQGGAFAISLMKVEVAGTVDLTDAAYGLTFTATTIEYENRLNVVTTTTVSVAGTCVTVQDDFYRQHDTSTGTWTGVTYQRTRTYTDGALTGDNGAPTPSGSLTWVIDHQTWTRSTNKTKTTVESDIWRRAVWAAYVEDALKVYTIEYAALATNTVSAVWIPQNPQQPLGLNGEWHFMGMVKPPDRHLISKIGTLVVHDQVWTFSPSLSDEIFTSFPPWVLDGYTDTQTMNIYRRNISEIVQAGEIVTGSGPGTTFTATYMLPVLRGGARWSTPLVALCTRVRVSSDINNPTFTTHSVWAPTGTNVATNIHVNNLYATWHPVLDDLRVSTQNICWF